MYGYFDEMVVQHKQIGNTMRLPDFLWCTTSSKRSETTPPGGKHLIESNSGFSKQFCIAASSRGEKWKNVQPVMLGGV